jgi:hypothetical protein
MAPQVMIDPDSTPGRGKHFSIHQINPIVQTASYDIDTGVKRTKRETTHLNLILSICSSGLDEGFDR